MSAIDPHQPDLEAAADAAPASQVSSVVHADGHPRPSPASSCAVVVKITTGGYKLYPISLSPDANGVQAMTRIRCHVLQLLRTKRISAKFCQFFTKIEVGTGTIQGSRLIGPSQPTTGLTVAFRDYEKNWEITRAFRKPAILDQDTSYITRDQHIAVNAFFIAGGLDGQQALIVREVINKTKIACFLSSLLLIPLGSGLAVGICTGDASVGISVCISVFVLASVLQGFAAWILG